MAAFPIGISIKGGIGQGYYSMDALNSHLRVARQEVSGTALKDLTKGINIALHGRLWLFQRYGVHLGYQHFWGDTEAGTENYTITYKTPADVYSIGGVVTVLSFPVLADINVGVNYCHIRSVYGSNLLTGAFLKEYKGNDNGYQVYAEAVTNFIRPVEIGFQLGYRGLKIKELEDKFGDVAEFPYSGSRVVLDYSGIFFFVTAGIRL